MNTPFTHSFHKTIVTSMLFVGCPSFAVIAQTTPSTQTPTPAVKPTTAPVRTPSAPAVSNQNPTAPVRIAPMQQPANRQVGSNPQNSDRSVPTSQFLNNQNTVPTSQTATGTPAGVGYNNSGGIVNSDSLQNDTLNHVHYHYHYDSQSGFSGATAPGYAHQCHAPGSSPRA